MIRPVMPRWVPVGLQGRRRVYLVLFSILFNKLTFPDRVFRSSCRQLSFGKYRGNARRCKAVERCRGQGDARRLPNTLDGKGKFVGASLKPSTPRLSALCPPELTKGRQLGSWQAVAQAVNNNRNRSNSSNRKHLLCHNLDRVWMQCPTPFRNRTSAQNGRDIHGGIALPVV